MELGSYRLISIQERKSLIISMVLGLIVVAHLPFFNWQSIIFLSHLGILSTLYNVPKDKKGIINLPLRSIPFLKVFLISYVWVCVSTILPILSVNEEISARNLIIFAAHFAFIMSITLPFDIRDYNSDNLNRLATIPQVIGINLTKLLAIICLIVFYVTISFFLPMYYLLPFSLITALLIGFSSPYKKYYYFTFAIDGTIILYLFVVVFS